MENRLLRVFSPVAFAIIALQLSHPSPAWAYTDPNTANFIFQLLFPVITVLGTGFLLFKNYIRRKINSFKQLFRKKDPEEKVENQSPLEP